MLNKSRESRTSTDDLAFFVRVAALDSLTAAARELGLSLPAVSKRLSQLEQRLGVQLLKRTTRRLELTAEGKRYLEGARPLLDQLAELEESVSSQTSVLRGSLNINASFGFGRRHVAPCVSRFAALHPELAMSLQLSSQPLIKRGELLHVLPQWSAADGDIFAVWQPQRQLPVRISAFVDFLQTEL